MLSLEEKLVALAYCLARDGHEEDAAGHLCDLLDYCRRKIRPSTRKPFRDLKEMVKKYGEHPTPIDEDPA